MNLPQLFSHHLALQIKKTYWGLTLGVPHPQRGVVDQRIGRRPGAQHMSCLLQDEVGGLIVLIVKTWGSSAGLNSTTHQAEAQLMKSTLVPATTRYKVLKHCDTHVALVEFQPLTGRR